MIRKTTRRGKEMRCAKLIPAIRRAGQAWTFGESRKGLEAAGVRGGLAPVKVELAGPAMAPSGAVPERQRDLQRKSKQRRHRPESEAAAEIPLGGAGGKKEGRLRPAPWDRKKGHRTSR